MKISNMGRIFLTPLFCFLMTAPGYGYTNRNTAVLQVMNKAAGKTQTISAPIGQTVEFEKLNILVRACKQSDPFEAENFYAFVEISKNNDNRFFSNWMDRNNPGKNPVQNADYDVWLVRCE